MNVIDEITALKKVVEILTPLEDGARRRVLAYAGSAFADKPVEAIAGGAREQFRPLASAEQKPVAPQEYLRRFNYKVMTKRIAVLAVYLERERQMKRFNFRDITDAFRIAKEPKTPAPSQYSRSVIMGYLARDGDQYYATSQAEALVDQYTGNGTDKGSD
jgi:hypothetical protein